MLDAEQIAKVAHEANKAFCETLGDFSQPSWKDAPRWQKDSAVNGVDFHLDKLFQGEVANPEDSHENWLKQKEAEGWVYGEVKDPAKKQHPCMVPYHQLPIEQRLKDYIFSSIVEAFYLAEDEKEGDN